MGDVGTVREWQDIAEKAEAGYDPCTPRFYMRPVPDPRRTEVEGRQCFKNVPYVEVFKPGNKFSRPNRKVKDDDKDRWPTAWAKFQKTREEATEGTPIGVWSYLDPARVAELRALGILTLEALAGMPDGQIGSLGPDGRDLVKRAQQAVQPQDATETELREERDTLKRQMNELTMKVEHLQQALDAATAPKKRGRPPKVRLNDPEDDMRSGA